MNHNREKIQAAIRWVEETIESNPFCDVTISLSSHDGRISKIQKSLTQKFIDGKK